jgi:hypothetical protein
MNKTSFKKGHTMSPEIRAKISAKMKGVKKSPETKAKMCISGKLNNSKITPDGRKRQSDKLRGRKASDETKLKMSLKRRGENHPLWKGGITPLVMQIRHHFKMRQWVSDVFYRDDFTCQSCYKRGGKLNAHHLKSFSKMFKENNIKTLEGALTCEELWDLNNGQTLCLDCHKKINTRRDG